MCSKPFWLWIYAAIPVTDSHYRTRYAVTRSLPTAHPARIELALTVLEAVVLPLDEGHMLGHYCPGGNAGGPPGIGPGIPGVGIPGTGPA